VWLRTRRTIIPIKRKLEEGAEIDDYEYRTIEVIAERALSDFRDSCNARIKPRSGVGAQLRDLETSNLKGLKITISGLFRFRSPSCQATYCIPEILWATRTYP
jgi:hypothetical protein